MLKATSLLVASMLCFFLIECRKNSSSVVEETNHPAQNDNVDFGFELIDTKIEFTGGLANRMDLYFPTRKIDPSYLDDLCKLNKRSIETTGFYYLVVFDEKKNAVFPNNPLSALFGVDEDPQKHIVAVYIYNPNHNYSKVSAYFPNMWEGKPSTYEIY